MLEGKIQHHTWTNQISSTSSNLSNKPKREVQPTVWAELITKPTRDQPSTLQPALGPTTRNHLSKRFQCSPPLLSPIKGTLIHIIRACYFIRLQPIVAQTSTDLSFSVFVPFMQVTPRAACSGSTQVDISSSCSKIQHQHFAPSVVTYVNKAFVI